MTIAAYQEPRSGIGRSWLPFGAMAKSRTKTPTRTAGAGRPIELTGRWLALAEAAGGVGALCAAIGVHKPSFYVWVRGGTMRGTSKTAVRAVAERLGVPSPIPEDT